MPVSPPPAQQRHRADRCPGVLSPWVAEDGALLRIRLVGGLLGRDQLSGLARLARQYGDGTLHLTARANIQVRGVTLPVPTEVAEGVAALGLLPSPTHERTRNIMVSPFTGRLGGLADLRPVARQLDERLCADRRLADLPARFLFCLDDRCDLQDRPADLAAVAVGPNHARLWAGGLTGDVVHLTEVADALVSLARDFMSLRGTGPSAPWHVSELTGGGTELGPFLPAQDAAPTAPPTTPPYGHLVQDDGCRIRHVEVPGGTLSGGLLDEMLAEATDEVVVTPWRSLLLPDLEVAG